MPKVNNPELKEIQKLEISKRIKDEKEGVKLLFCLMCYAGASANKLSNNAKLLKNLYEANKDFNNFDFTDTTKRDLFKQDLKDFIINHSKHNSKDLHDAHKEFGFAKDDTELFDGFERLTERTVGFLSMQGVIYSAAYQFKLSLSQFIIEYFDTKEHGNWTHNHPYILELIQKLKDGKYHTLPSDKSNGQEKKATKDEKKKISSALFNPYGSDASSLMKDYFPRVTIQNTIQDHINQNKNGYICIYGESGTGKSSLLASTYLSYAELTNSLCVYHVVRSEQGAGATLNFVSNLFIHLNEHGILAGAKHLIKDVTNLNISNCSIALTSIFSDINEFFLKKPNKILIIVIDSLEEISKEDISSSDLTVNDLLLPSNLPINTYIIVSSRNASKQKYLSPSMTFKLDSNNDIHENDLREYLSNKFQAEEIQSWANKNKLSKKEFTDLLILRSEHKFVYLSNVLVSIANFDKRSLPIGIEEFYNIEVARLMNVTADKLDYFNQLITALLWFRSGVSIGRLSIFISMNESTTMEFIKPLLKLDFIIIKNEGGVDFVSIKHSSFFYFLDNKFNVTNCQINHQNYANLFHDIQTEFRFSNVTTGYNNPTESIGYLCESMVLIIKSALYGRQFEEVIAITRKPQLGILVMQRCPLYFFFFDNECLNAFNKCFKYLLDNYSEEEALNYHLDYLNSEYHDNECFDSRFNSLVFNQHYRKNEKLENFYKYFSREYNNDYFFKYLLIMLSMALINPERMEGGGDKHILGDMLDRFEKEKISGNCPTTKKLIKTKTLNEFLAFIKLRWPLVVGTIIHKLESNVGVEIKPTGKYFGSVRFKGKAYPIGIGDINRPYIYIRKITIFGINIPITSNLSKGYDMKIGCTNQNWNIGFQEEGGRKTETINEGKLSKYFESVLGMMFSLLEIKIEGKFSSKYQLYKDMFDDTQLP